MSYTNTPSMSATTSRGPATKARRGDLVVYEKRTSYVTTSEGCHERMEYEVGTVTSITREGQVKAIADRCCCVPRPIDRIFGYQRCWIVSAQEIDVTAAVAAAQANQWPSGHAGMPFATLDDAAAAVRSFKVAA